MFFIVNQFAYMDLPKTEPANCGAMSCGLTRMPLPWKPQQAMEAAIQKRAPSYDEVKDRRKRKNATPASAIVCQDRGREITVVNSTIMEVTVNVDILALYIFSLNSRFLNICENIYTVKITIIIV